MMDLVHLRSFAEVAERGTVAAAAGARGYTAPAVSQHIAKLESELAIPLFDRVGRRLRLTDAGRALLPIALQMIDLETQGRMVADRRTETPHYVVAGFASALLALVIPVLADLGDGMTLEIHEREDADALRDLRLGRVDLVLVQEYDAQPVDRNERLTFTPLVVDQLRIALPPGMPRSTTLAELGEVRWLINGDGTRCAQATSAILDAAGLRPRISGSVADNATLLALVAAGQGVTIVPELLIDVSPHGVTIADQDLGVRRTIHAVARTTAMESVAPLLSQLTSRSALGGRRRPREVRTVRP